MNVALHPQRLDILSICTGGGGLDLGIELAIPGARSVCMVEREAFSAAQLVSAMEAGHLAPAAVWSDARTFDGRRWRGCVDGLIGGIPCQPHSLAGRKGGQQDSRDLWSTARRIIVQSKCWFVLIENVAGMLSPGDDEIAGAERVWRDLRKLGFRVAGGLFTAAEVGASHERERVFILGVADPGDARPQGSERRGSSGEWHRADAPRPIAELCRARLDEGGSRSLDDAFGGRWAAGRHDHRGDVRHQLDAAGEYALVDAPVVGRREGRAEPSIRSGRNTVAGASCRHDGLHLCEHLANANGDEQTAQRRHAGEVPRGAEGKGRAEHGPALPRGLGVPDFPPGPGDIDGWRRTLERAPELEPAFRRVADGLASRLDIARVDRLRMLGNGVVPLAAAYAVRTLATRLADSGSAGAARLVRMMEAA